MPRHRLFAPACLLACALSALPGVTAQAAEPLPHFQIDRNEVSVSGLSSGAFMAAQLQVAYSATFKGAGIVAGGPYYCAAGNIAYAGICMGQVPMVYPNAALMSAAARQFEAAGQIDKLSNLKKRRLYVFSGTKDTVVKPPAVNATVSFFKQVGVPDSQLLYVNNIPAGHAVITPTYGNACDANATPYISQCVVNGLGYDQSGALLAHIHGKLQPKATSLAGRMVTFNQRAFASAGTGMAEEAFLYVPPSCDAGQACKVHVAIHGCEQSAEKVGKNFIADTGYNEWAEHNRMLVLYPQVNASNVPFNPKGCWDWFGYTGPTYAWKAGSQMSAIKAMVDALGKAR
ncbi:PHB depolymerase family esterase [Sphaerotilus sp.]|uniref:extracellular catalytic domain type 2 short-chain-length polyhydroxyalkanoate depolymerase n=1 Tax=Sphaerotilus sp. TaxID=2093942 RepID=UPI002ACEEE15|nr:PHB depolymerase family esterase [Sphaerotilus sp.]MDZ7855131.1 PHB depolymerase family esterase [Sphaerotilus sp.]